MFNQAHIHTREKQEERATIDLQLPKFLESNSIKVIPFAQGALSPESFINNYSLED